MNIQSRHLPIPRTGSRAALKPTALYENLCYFWWQLDAHRSWRRLCLVLFPERDMYRTVIEGSSSLSGLRVLRAAVGEEELDPGSSDSPDDDPNAADGGPDGETCAAQQPPSQPSQGLQPAAGGLVDVSEVVGWATALIASFEATAVKAARRAAAAAEWYSTDSTDCSKIEADPRDRVGRVWAGRSCRSGRQDPAPGDADDDGNGVESRGCWWERVAQAVHGPHAQPVGLGGRPWAQDLAEGAEQLLQVGPVLERGRGLVGCALLPPPGFLVPRCSSSCPCLLHTLCFSHRIAWVATRILAVRVQILAGAPLPVM